MDRERDKIKKSECVYMCISVSLHSRLCMNEFQSVCVCECVCVCMLSKRYKPNMAGLPTSEIKACACVLLGPQCNGTTRLKLTHGWRKGTLCVCACVLVDRGPET